MKCVKGPAASICSLISCVSLLSSFRGSSVIQSGTGYLKSMTLLQMGRSSRRKKLLITDIIKNKIHFKTFTSGNPFVSHANVTSSVLFPAIGRWSRMGADSRLFIGHIVKSPPPDWPAASLSHWLISRRLIFWNRESSCRKDTEERLEVF